MCIAWSVIERKKRDMNKNKRMYVQILCDTHMYAQSILYYRTKSKFKCSAPHEQRERKKILVTVFFHTSFDLSMGYINALNKKKLDDYEQQMSVNQLKIN